MKQRRAILLAGAAGGLLVGAGTAWWRTGSGDAVPAPADGPDLWRATFERLDGTALPMQSLRGKPLLLNFWATWCAPCVTEMPLLDDFHERRTADWNVLALAVDEAGAARRFIAERSLRLPIALAGGAGVELSRRLGNAQGGLPFTVVFDALGAKVQTRIGTVDSDLLDRWVKTTR